MNLIDLKAELDKLNVPDYFYSLKGGLPSESCCIAQNNGKWEVYYSERGDKTGLEIFDTEDSACQSFLTMMKRIMLEL